MVYQGQAGREEEQPGQDVQNKQLHQQASKYVKTLALLYANFERICAEKKVEKQLGRDLDESLKMLSDNHSRCIKVAEFYARIEHDINEGFESYPQRFPRNGHSDFGFDL